METTPAINFRVPLKPVSYIIIVCVNLLVTAGLQYLWLFEDTPLLFRFWGFSFFPAYFCTLPVVLFLLRIEIFSLNTMKQVLGHPRLWAFSIGIPAIVFGGAVGVFSWFDGDLDPDWKWISLAISAGFDLPIVFLWLLPMLLTQELTWRSFISRYPGLSGATGVIVSSILWVLANGMLLWYLSDQKNLLFALSVAFLLFGSGILAYRLQVDGAIFPSAFSILVVATCAILLIGCEILEANHILFGYDVDTIAALFPNKILIHEIYLSGIGFSLIIISLFIRSKKN